MLHILWMIIRFILIILGVLLALLLLALLLILFCPVRYRAAASNEEEDFRKIQGEAAVSWLFHGISVRIRMEDQKLSHSIKIFGIPLEKLTGFIKKLKNRKRKDKPKQQSPSRAKAPSPAAESQPGHTKPEDGPEPKSMTKSKDEVKSIPEPKDEPESIPESKDEPKSMAEPKDESTPRRESGSMPDKNTEPGSDAAAEYEAESDGQDPSASSDNESAPKSGIFSKIRNRIYGFLEKLKELKKIPETFRKIALTIRGVYAKIDWWKQFLTHPRTKEALSLVRGTLVKLLRHVFPTRIDGKLTFGSEDPSVTGTVLALFGVTMPLHKNCIEICPVFEGTNILKGNIRLKGRIYGVVLLKAAVQIYFNKNIKYVINRWKHKEDDL
ncbi:MAG: DUF2953 domain-containing protein [Eubacteriales bacterium]|nr:DUF2953 domain-containing protein [Eubacteriales bacterium]